MNFGLQMLFYVCETKLQASPLHNTIGTNMTIYMAICDQSQQYVCPADIPNHRQPLMQQT